MQPSFSTTNYRNQKEIGRLSVVSSTRLQFVNPSGITAIAKPGMVRVQKMSVYRRCKEQQKQKPACARRKT